MSGPKIDQAELERLERERLERERQERLRRIAVATNECNEILKQARGEMHYILMDHRDVLDAFQDRPEMKATLQRVANAKESASTLLNNMLNIVLPPEPEDIQSLNRELKDELKRIKGQYSQMTQQEWSGIQSYVDKLAEHDHLLKLEDAAGDDEYMQMIAVFEIAQEAVDENTLLSFDIKEKAKTALSELTDIINSEFSSINMRQVFAKYARRIVENADKDGTALNNAIVEFNIAKQSAVRYLDECEALYQTYLAEYVLFIDIINEQRSKKLEIAPKSRRRFINKKALEDEIQEIQKASQEANEQNFIRSQIDEVMKLHHYNLCENLILDPEQTGQHFLCENENGQNAIHVYISETKQIMMEIVGTEVAKAPANSAVSAAMTEAAGLEAERLYAEQGQFCTIHPSITEELRKRGIILHEKVHRPKDLKYSKKIINYRSNVDRNVPKAYQVPRKKKDLKTKAL